MARPWVLQWWAPQSKEGAMAPVKGKAWVQSRAQAKGCLLRVRAMARPKVATSWALESRGKARALQWALTSAFAKGRAWGQSWVQARAWMTEPVKGKE